MLHEFLHKNEDKILNLTEEKTRELAGDHLSSTQLKMGLPIFYKQVIEIIRSASSPSHPPKKDIDAIAKAADRGDEPAMAEAAGQPQEAELAMSAGEHGAELLRLGYSLSHVVHAYGALCQAITEEAAKKKYPVTATEFHALNRCLDVAIAGAVTVYQSLQDAKSQGHDSLTSMTFALELRSLLTSVNVAFQAIKSGRVGFSGSTAQVMEHGLKRIEERLERFLIEEIGTTDSILKN